MTSLPYIGSKISLLTLADIRYEGILYTINTEESTIALQNVRSFGTEGRRTPNVPPSDEVYEYIIFRGKDIKDLTVLDEAPRSPRPAVLADPAIVTINNRPSLSSQPQSRRPQTAAPSVQYRREDRRNFQPSGGPPPQQTGGRGGRGLQDRPYSAQQPQYGARPAYHQAGETFNRNKQYRGNTNGRSFGGSRYPRNAAHLAHPVGELEANDNAATKAEVKEDFDFTSSNAAFEKPAEATTAAATAIREGYNKKKSFFDDISCDALDRQNGGHVMGAAVVNPRDPKTREKVRATDRETFGTVAVNRNFRSSGNVHTRRY